MILRISTKNAVGIAWLLGSGAGAADTFLAPKLTDGQTWF